MNTLGRLGLGFIIGSSVLTLCLFVISWLEFPITLGSLCITIIFLTTLFLLFKSFIPKQLSARKESWKGADKIILSVIIALLLVVIINGLWNVVSVWDALTLYDFRALRIVETGSVAQAAMIQGEYFYGYPLFTSLAHAVLYLIGLNSSMIFYSLLFLSFVSVFYNLVRRSVSRTLALLATLLVIIAPHLFWHAQIAYTNLPYTIYLGLGAIYILEYLNTGKRTDALLGALLTGLSIWVRSVEPFWLINMLLLLVSTLVKKQFFTTIISLIIFIPLERIWKVYVAVAHNTVAQSTLSQVAGVVTAVSGSSTSIFIQLMPVLTYFVANAIRPYLPILMLLVISLVYKISHKSLNLVGEFIIVGYYAAALYGTYIFSLSQSYWAEIPGSLERMMIFVSPIILYNFFISIHKYYD